MKFKKKIIATNKDAINEAEVIAQQKMTILSEALKEAEKHIEVTYFKEFCEDFITYTTKKIVEKNKGLKDGAAFSSPLKSQESRFLIPDKTHRKAVPLAGVVPV